MWKSLFFLGNPGRKREKPLWNGCGGRVERKAAPCSFTHPRGNPVEKKRESNGYSHPCERMLVECGKKVEKRSRRKLWFSTGFVECGKLIHRDV